MFEVGFSELLLIMALALIVLGPEKLPKLASQVGRWMGRARSMARQFREQLEEEATLEESTKRRPAAATAAAPAAATTTATTAAHGDDDDTRHSDYAGAAYDPPTEPVPVAAPTPLENPAPLADSAPADAPRP